MTTEEIQAEADKRYPSLRNHITTEEDVQDALNDGFAEGAEWAQQQIIDKAAEWLYANDFGIGTSKRELIDNFKKAMGV